MPRLHYQGKSFGKRPGRAEPSKQVSREHYIYYSFLHFLSFSPSYLPSRNGRAPQVVPFARTSCIAQRGDGLVYCSFGGDNGVIFDVSRTLSSAALASPLRPGEGQYLPYSYIDAATLCYISARRLQIPQDLRIPRRNERAV